MSNKTNIKQELKQQNLKCKKHSNSIKPTIKQKQKYQSKQIQKQNKIKQKQIHSQLQSQQNQIIKNNKLSQLQKNHTINQSKDKKNKKQNKQQKKQKKQKNKINVGKLLQKQQQFKFSLSSKNQQEEQAIKRIIKLQEDFQNKAINSKAANCITNMLKSIQHDILINNLVIPQQQGSIDKFILMQKKKKQKQKQLNLNFSQDKKLEEEYNKLLEKKQMMKSQLKQIEEQESQLKRYQLLNNSVGDNNSSTLFNKPHSTVRYTKIPQLKSQDRKKWLSLRQKIKQNQIYIKQRIQQNEQKIKQQIQEQLQLQRKRKNQLSQQKRKILQQKIQKIKKRQQDRTKHIKEQSEIIQRLKNKKKLYQKMEEQFKDQQEKSNIERQSRLLIDYLQKRQLNMNQIKQHQKKYDQKMIIQREKRFRKISQNIINSSRNILSLNLPKSSFLEGVIEQDKKNKFLEQQKIHQIRELFDKKREYSSSLKERIRIKVKLNQEDSNRNGKKQSTQTQTSQKLNLKGGVRSLSALDIHHKGNQYMRSIHSSLVQQFKSIQKRQLKVQKVKQQKFKYKNYLNQIKMYRTANSQSNNKNTSNSMKQINSLINRPNMTQEQKFYEAQRITKRIQAGGKEKNLLTSINAKIEILKKLAHGGNEVEY